MTEKVEVPNYPSNKKEEIIELKEEVRKLPQITTSKVKKKKKSWGQKALTIFDDGDDKDTVKSYLVWDVFLPAAKDLVSDMVSGGIDMLLFGENRGRTANTMRRHRGTSSVRPGYTNYGAGPQPRGGVVRRGYSEPSYNERPMHAHTSKARHNFDDILIESRGEAEEVLAVMVDLVDQYEMVTVADLYDLVGMSSSYTDRNFGWTNLSRATVDRVRGGYLIRLPRTEVLD